MSENLLRIIRDPIHNIIPFENNPTDELLLKLIDTKEFQRLRRLKQLGMAELVFPAANHSRFVHSIGVMHTARKILEQIKRLGIEIEPKAYMCVLVAALLHDIGHGPFSHAFEKVTDEKHEKRTREIISDSSTKINEVLRTFDPDLPKWLMVFFPTEESANDAPQTNQPKIPAYLKHIVSSQLDADRFDYLLRDSYTTGTDYGNFDLSWLVQHLNVNTEQDRFYLNRKAFSVGEAYIYARYHMYKSVYFHKATRAAEVMLRLICTRYKALLESTDSQENKRRFVANAPEIVLNAFSKKNTPLAEYLLLDECVMTEFFKACSETNNDSILKELGSGLIHRKLFKCTDVTVYSKPKVARFYARVRDLIKEKEGAEQDFKMQDDMPTDTPYKPYDPEETKSAIQIYVETLNGEQREISTISKPIESLTKEYELVRYYYPERFRDEIKKIAIDIL